MVDGRALLAEGPIYGAALDILKVEIGGDTDSTAGAEASHMRTRDEVDCDRG